MSQKSQRNRKSTPAPRPEPPAAQPAAPATRPVAGSNVASSPRTAISPEQRRRMIAEAAYYRAQRRGFHGDPVRDWTEAEAEIDAQLLSRH